MIHISDTDTWQILNTSSTSSIGATYLTQQQQCPIPRHNFNLSQQNILNVTLHMRQREQ